MLDSLATWFHNRPKVRLAALLTAPLFWLLVAYVGSLCSLLVTAFYSINSFTGDVINVGYGPVQVKITVTNGKITEATAVQAPSGRSQRFTDYSVPNLRQQTLSAQSAAISGVSGASYTSYGWYKSLITALQKAGMPTGV